MTLNEARRIQKETETRVVLKFFSLFIMIGIASFLLFYYTDILSRSTVFYLLPVIALFFLVKKTEIYKFFTPKETIGTVVNIDVYAVKTGSIKGEHTYETRQGEALEAEVIIKTDKGRTASKTVFHSGVTASIGVGSRVAFLRFIYEPIIL